MSHFICFFLVRTGTPIPVKQPDTARPSVFQTNYRELFLKKQGLLLTCSIDSFVEISLNFAHAYCCLSARPQSILICRSRHRSSLVPTRRTGKSGQFSQNCNQLVYMNNCVQASWFELTIRRKIELAMKKYT